MIELTIGDLLDGDHEEIEYQYRLYVIRDNATDLVFYVGQSRDGALDRVLQHLGVVRGFPGDAPIARLLRRAMPESREWLVQFHRVDEVIPGSEGMRRDLDKAERLLIAELRPCLNVTYNPHGRELPPEYDWLVWGCDKAKAAEAMADVIDRLGQDWF